MKNIKQIKAKIKKSGLTGAAFRIEFEQKITKRAQSLLTEIVFSPDEIENLEPEYISSRIFEILEIFRTGEIADNSRRDIADALQLHLFSLSNAYYNSFDEYKKNLLSEVSR